jgi:phosphohistidine swiveling domain-containing protein
MRKRPIVSLSTIRGLERVGAKATNLRFLMDEGFPTPKTYVCTWEACLHFQQDPDAMRERLRAQLEPLLDPRQAYAVRSSASVEDEPAHSFAGQFTSVLNVRGSEAVLQAIEQVWASAHAERVLAYMQKMGRDPRDVKMAVIIQEMVVPVISGVAFSRNPMTGMSETIVEAMRGSGEALMQEGVTPQRWVSKWGTWTATPQETDIPLAVIEDVVTQTQAIARAYGKPVDLEWVYDGQRVVWVQLREITALEEVNVYSNRISREYLPGIIKPLIWSVNIPLVNGAWVWLFTEMIGPNDIHPNTLAKSFYYRAYFNMGAIGRIFELLGLPREALELLMGIEVEGPEKPTFKPSRRTYALLPRMLRFAWGKWRFHHRVESFLAQAPAQYQTFDVSALDTLSAPALLAEVDRLYGVTQRVAYYNIVTPLLMQLYNRALRGLLRRCDVEFDRFDLTHDAPKLEELDPNVHLAQLNRRYQQLPEALRDAIQREGLAALPHLEGEGTAAFRAAFQDFMACFGHFSDSGNDFSVAPWRENPELVLHMAVNYRQPTGQADQKVCPGELKPPLPYRWLFDPLCRRAQRFLYYREAMSSHYTFGYGLFRDYFLALGRQFVSRGLLDSPADIFYLSLDEIREAVARGQAATSQVASVARRKTEIADSQDVTLPTVIYGDEPPLLETRTSDVLKGVPTSRGYHTGPVTVVQGIQDFPKVQPGDVLVIPYSDVGWAPLFTRASAVVAESGGILSHSSIVAREYSIPAVVSVPGACRLADGTQVTVDGYQGVVKVHALKCPPAAGDV